MKSGGESVKNKLVVKIGRLAKSDIKSNAKGEHVVRKTRHFLAVVKRLQSTARVGGGLEQSQSKPSDDDSTESIFDELLAKGLKPNQLARALNSKGKVRFNQSV